MTLRKIHTESNGHKTAKVYRDSDWQEYRVRLYINGVLHAGADYHTDDDADALDSALAMVASTSGNLKRLIHQDATRTPPGPLSVPFNVAVLHIASRVLPCGFDVSADAPQTFESLIAHYEKTGRVLVWNGASDRTIFADSEINFAFRAWHDSKHILGRHLFTREGEIAAMEMQKADIRALFDGQPADSFCDLVESEIIGQLEYSESRGGFPIDQAAFARAYLVNKESAVAGNFGVSREAS